LRHREDPFEKLVRPLELLFLQGWRFQLEGTTDEQWADLAERFLTAVDHVRVLRANSDVDSGTLDAATTVAQNIRREYIALVMNRCGVSKCGECLPGTGVSAARRQLRNDLTGPTTTWQDSG
jgi:hypothetical protein